MGHKNHVKRPLRMPAVVAAGLFCVFLPAHPAAAQGYDGLIAPAPQTTPAPAARPTPQQQPATPRRQSGQQPVTQPATRQQVTPTISIQKAPSQKAPVAQQRDISKMKLPPEILNNLKTPRDVKLLSDYLRSSHSANPREYKPKRPVKNVKAPVLPTLNGVGMQESTVKEQIDTVMQNVRNTQLPIDLRRKYAQMGYSDLLEFKKTLDMIDEAPFDVIAAESPDTAQFFKDMQTDRRRALHHLNEALRILRPLL